MFARTRRLTLRPGWPEDAAALAAAIGHQAVATRLSNVPWPYGRANAVEFLSRQRGRDDVFMLIYAHEDAAPRLVGGIGIHPEGEAHTLGYWLTPDAWGRGYATEAGRAVVHMARESMPITRLAATYHRDNAASGRVLTKLGFRPTGRIVPIHSCARNETVDAVEMSLDLAGDSTMPAMPMAA